MLHDTRGTDRRTIHLHKHLSHLPGPVEKNEADSVIGSYCKNGKNTDAPAPPAHRPFGPVMGSSGVWLCPSVSGGLAGHLQVVALHQAARLQWAAVREEGGLHVQAFLCQRGVAAGGGTHLPRFGEVGLLPLG